MFHRLKRDESEATPHPVYLMEEFKRSWKEGYERERWHGWDLFPGGSAGPVRMFTVVRSKPLHGELVSP